MSIVFGHGKPDIMSKKLRESNENLELVGPKSPPTISITWSDMIRGLSRTTPLTKLDQNKKPVFVFIGK